MAGLSVYVPWNAGLRGEAVVTSALWPVSVAHEGGCLKPHGKVTWGTSLSHKRPQQCRRHLSLNAIVEGPLLLSCSNFAHVKDLLSERM